jgi:hypothetical protein
MFAPAYVGGKSWAKPILRFSERSAEGVRVSLPGQLTQTAAAKNLLLSASLMYITYHPHEEHPTIRRRPQHPALLLLPHAWLLSLAVTTSLNRD